MIVTERRFGVSRNAAVVVEYLMDFAHAEQWDPGTVSCVQTSSGPPRVGTIWHNVSRFRGRETELRYELVAAEPDHLRFVGTNTTATSIDDITVTDHASDPQASTIVYRSEITFRGWARLVEPFLRRELNRLGDQTEHDIVTAVDGLS